MRDKWWCFGGIICLELIMIFPLWKTLGPLPRFQMWRISGYAHKFVNNGENFKDEIILFVFCLMLWQWCWALIVNTQKHMSIHLNMEPYQVILSCWSYVLGLARFLVKAQLWPLGKWRQTCERASTKNCVQQLSTPTTGLWSSSFMSSCDSLNPIIS